uniref:Cytochrome P450 n=1 Tax=Agasicles hygrophila TaxID=715812 RepID=A0A3Q8AJ91_9CUCU|nr:cytochrome P450 [Agasicles hygrophila]
MFILLIIIAVIAVAYYLIKSLTYWKNKGIPQGPIWYWIKDDINTLYRNYSFSERLIEIYNMIPGTRYCGVYQFTKPFLLIKDVELLKEITVKNFDHFTDHSNVIPEGVEPLWVRNLFVLKGQKWRYMRPILSPSFTSSKMRTIFELISECTENFIGHFQEKNDDIIEVELKETFTRFTTDVIATTAFGLKTNSLKDPTNDFFVMGQMLSKFASGFRNLWKFMVLALSPTLFKILNLSIFDKKVMSFFTDIIDQTIKVRKEQGIIRPDMIHLLIEAQKSIAKEEQVEDLSFAAHTESDLGQQNVAEKKELTNMDIAAQALIFFFAGFDSVAIAMSFMGYELAVNEEVQDRLRKEIKDTLEKCNGKLTYEALNKMKYFDMVVSESLRKWPSASISDRECTKAFTIEPKLPSEKPLHLKEKSILWVPIAAIHRNPNYYPDPEKFDPERFNDENKHNIDPNAYLPFGLGPRNCIGSRFALMEIKTIYFYLLQHFELIPVKRSQIPVQLSLASFQLNAKDGFWFGFKRI